MYSFPLVKFFSSFHPIFKLLIYCQNSIYIICLCPPNCFIGGRAVSRSEPRVLSLLYCATTLSTPNLLVCLVFFNLNILHLFLCFIALILPKESRPVCQMSNFAGLSDYFCWLDWVYYIWQEYDLRDTASHPRTHNARLFLSQGVTYMRRSPLHRYNFHFAIDNL